MQGCGRALPLPITPTLSIVTAESSVALHCVARLWPLVPQPTGIDIRGPSRSRELNSSICIIATMRLCLFQAIGLLCDKASRSTGETLVGGNGMSAQTFCSPQSVGEMIGQCSPLIFLSIRTAEKKKAFGYRNSFECYGDKEKKKKFRRRLLGQAATATWQT